MLTIQEIVLKFAELLSKELKAREVSIAACEQANRRHGDWNNIEFAGDKRQFLALPVAVEYRTLDRTAGLDLFFSKNILAVKELAIKASRPYKTQFAHIEIPKCVFEAAIAEFDDVVVRAVSDYYIALDQIVTRFDCMVSWEDAAMPIFGIGPGLPIKTQLAA